MPKTKKEEYFDPLDEETKAWITETKDEILYIYNLAMTNMSIYYNEHMISEEEKTGIWAILPSEIRTAIKKYNAENKESK